MDENDKNKSTNDIIAHDDSFVQHYKKKYIDSIDLADKSINNIIINTPLNNWKYSGINRYDCALALMYRALPDSTDTITALYKIKDIHTRDKEVSYAVGYIEQMPKKSANTLYIDILEKKYGKKLSPSDNIFINNVCITGSVISKDGEYRSVILNWNSFQVLIKVHENIKKIYDYIYEYFSVALRERKYILLTEYYFPTDKLKNRFHYETELLCSSNKIQLFCIVWFNFYYTFYFGMVSNHTNEIFKGLMFKYKNEDIDFFKSIWKKFTYADIELFRYVCSNYVKDQEIETVHIYKKTKLGQKIIPLNLIEAQNFFNIEYAPWKEFFINIRASDLVINHISNGFSMASSWFIIKNSNKQFFDNPAQADKLERSQIAIRIAELLTQAAIYTKHNINAENDMDFIGAVIQNMKNDSGIAVSWLSNEFKALYKKINDSIDYTKENIIMSNVSLGLITEFTGKTLYDAVFFSKKSAYYKKIIPNIFDVKNYTHFRKYMFQICYNLYCLNSKLHVIHGDLHLNNMTLNPLFYKKNVSIDVKDPKILYILNDQYQYIFSNNFYDICIIDFSRSIIDVEYHAKFKMDHIPYDITHNKDHLLRRQTKELLNYLYSTKPEYKQFESGLENNMLYNFSAYFKILTTLDLYNLTSKFIDFLKSNHSIKPCKDSVGLVMEINRSAEYYISVILNRLITQRNFKEIEEMDWPLFSIINDIFNDNRFTKSSISDKIVDIYNFKNNMEYSLSSLKYFPHILQKKDVLIKRRKQYETKNLQNYQVVNIIQTRQLQKNI